MKGFSTSAARAAALVFVFVLSAAPAGPVSFESKPRAVAKGIFPQVAVRATGDLSLLTVEGRDPWYLSSTDGGDRFPTRVRLNETPHEVMAHGENVPILTLRSMCELYAGAITPHRIMRGGPMTLKTMKPILLGLPGRLYSGSVQPRQPVREWPRSRA